MKEFPNTADFMPDQSAYKPGVETNTQSTHVQIVAPIREIWPTNENTDAMSDADIYIYTRAAAEKIVDRLIATGRAGEATRLQEVLSKVPTIHDEDDIQKSFTASERTHVIEFAQIMKEYSEEGKEATSPEPDPKPKKEETNSEKKPETPQEKAPRVPKYSKEGLEDIQKNIVHALALAQNKLGENHIHTKTLKDYLEKFKNLSQPLPGEHVISEKNERAISHIKSKTYNFISLLHKETDTNPKVETANPSYTSTSNVENSQPEIPSQKVPLTEKIKTTVKNGVAASLNSAKSWLINSGEKMGFWRSRHDAPELTARAREIINERNRAKKSSSANPATSTNPSSRVGGAPQPAPTATHADEPRFSIPIEDADDMLRPVDQSRGAPQPDSTKAANGAPRPEAKKPAAARSPKTPENPAPEPAPTPTSTPENIPVNVSYERCKSILADAAFLEFVSRNTPQQGAAATQKIYDTATLNPSEDPEINARAEHNRAELIALYERFEKIEKLTTEVNETFTHDIIAPLSKAFETNATLDTSRHETNPEDTKKEFITFFEKIAYGNPEAFARYVATSEKYHKGVTDIKALEQKIADYRKLDDAAELKKAAEKALKDEHAAQVAQAAGTEAAGTPTSAENNPVANLEVLKRHANHISKSITFISGLLNTRKPFFYDDASAVAYDAVRKEFEKRAAAAGDAKKVRSMNRKNIEAFIKELDAEIKSAETVRAQTAKEVLEEKISQLRDEATQKTQEHVAKIEAKKQTLDADRNALVTEDFEAYRDIYMSFLNKIRLTLLDPKKKDLSDLNTLEDVAGLVATSNQIEKTIADINKRSEATALNIIDTNNLYADTWAEEKKNQPELQNLYPEAESYVEKITTDIVRDILRNAQRKLNETVEPSTTVTEGDTSAKTQSVLADLRKDLKQLVDLETLDLGPTQKPMNRRKINVLSIANSVNIKKVGEIELAINPIGAVVQSIIEDLREREKRHARSM
jgi:hypothetical protein